ncbi:MAG: carboxypeptidase-like regulatory domain-containing protein, partial [Thermoanaerobaculia bacterium]|nr:carboxypeptidase-like regulatory domain-containing protein [Thermoanaerobaculia bacterium]
WKTEYYRPKRDSLAVAPPSVVVEWVPDGSLERVRGKVTDPRGRELPGVVIEVEGRLDTTDNRGNYELHIPPAMQKTHYLLYATAKGFQPYRGEAWPAT